MAVTRGPLMSLAASGSIAGTLTFATWKGRSYVRQLVTPSNPNSIGQRAARAIVRFGSQQFANLSAGNQALWAAIASDESLTPIDVFVRDAGRRRLLDLLFRETPTGSGGTANGAPTTPLATGQRRQVTFSWVNSVVGTVYQTGIFQGNTGFTANGSNLVYLVPAGVTSITLTGYDPGNYFFKIVHGNNNGVLGTASAQLAPTVT